MSLRSRSGTVLSLGGGGAGGGVADGVATVSANLGLNELFSESANFATAVTFIQPSTEVVPADAALILVNFGKDRSGAAMESGIWFLVPAVWWRSITATTATTITLDTARLLRDFVVDTASGTPASRDLYIGRTADDQVLVASRDITEDAYDLTVYTFGGTVEFNVDSGAGVTIPGADGQLPPPTSQYQLGREGNQLMIANYDLVVGHGATVDWDHYGPSHYLGEHPRSGETVHQYEAGTNFVNNDYYWNTVYERFRVYIIGQPALPVGSTTALRWAGLASSPARIRPRLRLPNARPPRLPRSHRLPSGTTRSGRLTQPRSSKRPRTTWSSTGSRRSSSASTASPTGTGTARPFAGLRGSLTLERLVDDH